MKERDACEDLENICGGREYDSSLRKMDEFC